MFDIRFSQAQFDRSLLQALLPIGEQAAELLTFLSCDFYDHDSRESEQVPGYEPIYNTLFSFKNTMDDFYVKHLESDFLTVDVFANVKNKTLKVGTARVVLSVVLQDDFNF